MKITKILSLLVIFVILLSFVSCDQIHSHFGHGTSNSNQTGNDDTDNNQEKPKATYIYSVLSKTIHLPGCYHIDRIKEDYLKETNSLAPLFEKGYTICRDCFHVKDEDDEKEEEEDVNKIPKEEATFVINSSSAKMHHLDCYHVEGMVEKNLEYTDLTFEELLELEYTPCKTCMPDEAKEYYKNHPEEEEK